MTANDAAPSTPTAQRYPIGQHPDAPPGHLHPNPVTCWRHGCRHPDCAKAEHARQSRIRLAEQRARGKVLMPDLLAHLRMLEAAGATAGGIAKAARANREMVTRLLRGTHASFPAFTTRARLMAVTPDQCAWVGTEATRRRVHALMAIGWSAHQIAATAGLSATPVNRISCGQPHARPSTVAAINRAYDELSTREGPSQQVRNIARRKGWHPPGWWDDIDAGTGGTPDVDPLEAAVEDLRTLLARGHTLPDALTQVGLPANTRELEVIRARRDRVRELTAQGYSSVDIAGLLDIWPRLVTRDLDALRAQGITVTSHLTSFAAHDPIPSARRDKARSHKNRQRGQEVRTA